MKIIKKYVFVLLVIFLILTPSLVNAAALTYSAAFFGSTLPSSKYSNLYVFSTDASNTYYGSYINSARSSWSSISGANVNMMSTSGSASSADLRLYTGEYGADYYGLTMPYRGTGTLVTNPDDGGGNWSFVNINFNKGQMDRAGFGPDNVRYCILHEIGHALGLRHQTDSSVDSVLRTGKIYNIILPGSVDRTNLAWKY